jgi:gluconolactonase
MPLPLKRASVFADGLDHPECVAYHPDGTFYAGGEAGQIYRISADGKRVEEIARSDGGFILGVAISPDGTWLAACDLRKKVVWRLDLNGRTLQEFAGGFSIPNHLAFTTDGDLYVTDSGAFRQVNGKIYKFDATAPAASGTPAVQLCQRHCDGTGWQGALRRVHLGAGVERVEIREDGSAGKRSVFARFPRTCPDGWRSIGGATYMSRATHHPASTR